MKKEITIIIIHLAFCLGIQAQNNNLSLMNPQSEMWADSILNTMTLNEKIGQLFIASVPSNWNKKQGEDLERLIEQHNIGGIIFFKGDIKDQAVLTNKIREKSKHPLFVSIDAEWGLSMRLNGAFAYPWAMTLGAINGEDLIYKMGKRIAYHCRLLGVNINFAPVADINTNPKNPVIGNRSFGSDKENVSKKCIAYVKGLQEIGVIASAKHFPGHGNTSKDSHVTLPVIDHDRDHLEHVELYPFKKSIDAGILSVMIGHLSVPSLDKTMPSSLSKEIINNMLKNEMAFGGLVVTDGLNMKAVSELYPKGELALKAFEAGNDILLMPDEIPTSIEVIRKAVEEKKISVRDLEYRVKKILMAKHFAGLNNKQTVNTQGLYEELNSPLDTALCYEMFKKAITVLKNQDDILPLKNVDEKIAMIQLDRDASSEEFKNFVYKYTSKVDTLKVDQKNLPEVLKKLKEYSKVLISIHKSSENPWKKYQVSNFEKEVIDRISEQNKVILSIFASPYSLLDFQQVKKVSALILGYQNTDFCQMLVPQVIFGAQPASGRLPVDIDEDFPVNSGIDLKSINRLGFNFPTNQRFDHRKLLKVDSLINSSIQDSVMPGCQLLVARNGEIVYEKAYGYHTYDKKVKVKTTDIYDLASITKVMSTGVITMKMVEEGKVKLFQTLGEIFTHINGIKNSDKDTINIREALCHFSKLPPSIKFYSKTLEDEKLYSKKKSKGYSLQVAQELFIADSYKDSIIKKIMDFPLLEKKKYKYSCIIFHLMKYHIEQVYGKSIDRVADEYFYSPIGSNTLTYNPLNKFPKEHIVPTENDTLFRKQLLRGYVHDETAALQGGLGGNAGLFSSAYDLSKMAQMLLQRGYYGGRQYINKLVFDEFNTVYFDRYDNRRAICFDKPPLEQDYEDRISKYSFGHYGYTGTVFWADPQEEIVYIFLSNRVNPTRYPNKLSQKNVRVNLRNIIYKSLEKW
ncbi:glycoside hydrolase family 3 N-terminal domain-containing protein [Ichthyobacterium seriolicida]|nr:glycoside hydrolase family 3 N-terminal domain-containing protein [Ichthyobacterium seriolicida]